MKKKLLIPVLAAVLVLALLLIGLPLFSQLVWGRSLAATLLIRQFDKRQYLTGEAFEEYLTEKRLENGAPYILPVVPFTVPVFQSLEDDMQVFTLLGGQDRMIVYLPGGAYIDQPGETHWRFLNALAADTDARVYVPIYPKLPENDAETACAALLDWYAERIREQRPDQVVFMGDSAGGGLALSLAMQLRDAGLRAPDRLVLICPWADVTMENPDIPAYEQRDPILNGDRLRQLGLLWAGDLDPADPMVSPLYGNLSGLGPVTLFTTDGELLYPDLLRLRDAFAEAGVPCETVIPEGRLFHVWPLFGWMDVPECREAYQAVVDAVIS